MTREGASDGRLTGTKIVLAVTGSIAAVDTIRLAHALRRRGAKVQGVMSEAAQGIIHADALAYATSRPVITRISGDVEHVRFCGEGGEGDLLLIAPCTGNTLAKIAAGIDDTPVTTCATTAIGSGLPVVIAPAMHLSMYRHPAIVRAIETVEEWGVTVIPPFVSEGKAKIAPVDEIVLRVERRLFSGPLAGKKILITSGPCREPLDDVRVLTTRSSGMMGAALAREAFRLGGEVTMVHSGATVPCVKNISVITSGEMRNTVLSQLRDPGADIYLSAAAISDFAPDRHEGKIRSGQKVTCLLHPLPKLLPEVIREFRPVTVAFKMGWDEEGPARSLLDQGAAMVVMNTPDVMGAAGGTFTLVTDRHHHTVNGDKEEVARLIFAFLLSSS